jgi:hypothetical protein
MKTVMTFLRTRVALLVLGAAVATVSVGCGASKSGIPTTPTTVATAIPKFTVPTPQSPTNSRMVPSLTATLDASPATVDSSALVPQYRFQVTNDAGTLVLDSGLVAVPSWTTPVALAPNKPFAWKVRAEAQGWAGPWSEAALFVTPDPPPAYAGAIGNWQACAGLKSATLVICVWNTIRPTNSVGDFEVVKRVAWLLRGEGAGLLIKTGGENVVLWQGYSFSATRICFPDGRINKLIGDAGPGGGNSPGWAADDFVSRALYVPAIDPSKP